MDGLENKKIQPPKENPNAGLILGVLFLVVIIAVVFFGFSQKKETTDPSLSVVTKLQKKTYMKYIPLDSNNGDEATASPTIAPTYQAQGSDLEPTVFPKEQKTETENEDDLPESEVLETENPVTPTEIIIANEIADSSSTASITEEDTLTNEVATLPTSGVIQSTVIIFAVSFFVILAAFLI